jgi:hypothetical protein
MLTSEEREVRCKLEVIWERAGQAGANARCGEVARHILNRLRPDSSRALIQSQFSYKSKSYQRLAKPEGSMPPVRRIRRLSESLPVE